MENARNYKSMSCILIYMSELQGVETAAIFMDHGPNIRDSMFIKNVRWSSALLWFERKKEKKHEQIL